MRKTFNRLIMVALLTMLMLSGATSCKSKKAASRSKAAIEAQYKEKVDKAKATLNAILSGETTWSLKEQETKVSTIKSDALHDPELDELIARAEKYIKNERIAAGLDVDKPHVITANSKTNNTSVQVVEKVESKLNTLFDKIANGNDTSTNIAEAKKMFVSDNVPVLIIISQSNGVTDYDRPTTVGKYLDYLKDQKVSRNKVYSVKYDENNKINELELIKK